MDWEEALHSHLPRGVASKSAAVAAASWNELHPLPAPYNRASVFLGYRHGQGVGTNSVLDSAEKDDKHVLLVAGSRAGKGVSIIVPNLLLYEGSILAIDPKGELAATTASKRARMGQSIFVLNPFRIPDLDGVPAACFNPLAEIDPHSPSAVDDAALIAEALIYDEKEDHWTSAARDLLRCLILEALTLPAADANLNSVRQFFRLPNVERGDQLLSGQTKFLAELVVRYEAGALDAFPFGDVIAGLASSFLAKPEKEAASIISTADTQLGFLDSKELAPCLARSDFSLADIKNKKTTVYLCLPASRMATHAKWFRVIITLALLAFQKDSRAPEPPALFLLDEFAVMGYLRQLEAAAGQIASYGVKLVVVLQDLGQLKKLYGDTWETFVGNSGTLIFFGNNDVTTLDYISKKLGTIGFDIQRATGAGLDARLAGAAAIQDQLQTMRLLEPHEAELLFARHTLRALILPAGREPFIVKRAIYHAPDEQRLFL